MGHQIIDIFEGRKRTIHLKNREPDAKNIQEEKKRCKTSTSFSKDASKHNILFPKHDANSPTRETLQVPAEFQEIGGEGSHNLQSFNIPLGSAVKTYLKKDTSEIDDLPVHPTFGQ